jgi:molybdate transport system ATP-binding protein
MQVLRDTSAGIDVPIRERGIGYVPQDSALFPHLGVRGNITYGAARGKACRFSQSWRCSRSSR